MPTVNYGNSSEHNALSAVETHLRSCKCDANIKNEMKMPHGNTGKQDEGRIKRIASEKAHKEKESLQIVNKSKRGRRIKTKPEVGWDEYIKINSLSPNIKLKKFV